MGILDNFDQTTWILFGLLAAAILAYYFWPENTKAQAEVTIDEATRKQARPMIALAADAVDGELFELSPMPLRISATGRLKTRLGTSDEPKPDEIAEALWTQQRAMVTRLEGELDYAQQADVSAHFAIAAPANQPASLLEKTLKELEQLHGQLLTHLQLPQDKLLWHGRAMVLMLSNRKLFDHVAWLTSAGLAASAPGAFTLCDSGVVMITIYATRLGGFARPLTLQVSRAAVRSTGGATTPLWLEYGMAYWLTNKILGKPQLAANEQAPAWNEQCKQVLDEPAWEKASEDSAKLEQLVIAADLLVANIMARQPDKLISELKNLGSTGQATFSWACEMFPESANA